MKKRFLNFGVGLLLCIVLLNGQDVNHCFFEYSGLKNARTPLFIDAVKTTAPPSVTIHIDAATSVTRVSDYIYGTNANIYSGRYNNEPKLIEYVKLLSPNIIRFPGGNHSNVYFWNATPTAFPEDLPEKLLVGYNDDSYDPDWYSGSGDSWYFGLDEFYEFLDQAGCEGLITVNYSYARLGTGPTPVQTAAHLAADWVRYDDGRTTFWEIGNENCASWSVGYKIDTELNQDGQPKILTPKLYGEHAKVFIDSMKKAAEEIDHIIYVGVQNDRGVLEGVGNAADWFVDHTYFTPYQQNSSISVILNSVEKEVSSFVQKSRSESNKWGTDFKPNTMTEWNIFACQSNQRASYINGMHAVIVLGDMIKLGYGMANRWDIANTWGDLDGSGPESTGDDFGMFSRGDDPDGNAVHWNPRAPFFYMYYFQHFFGDHMVQSSVYDNKDILAYASRFRSGEISVVIVNRSQSEEVIQLIPDQFDQGERYYVYSLTGGTDNGDFSYQVFVNGAGPETQLGGPIEDLKDIEAEAYFTDPDIRFVSPPLSVQFVLIEGDFTVSVHEASRAHDTSRANVVVYPSPVQQTFKMHLNHVFYEQMKMFDILGRQIMSVRLDPAQSMVEINTTLASGMYFIQLQNATTTTFQKVMVLR